MNPKHTLKEYADALTRAGLLTASTLTPAAEGTVIDCVSYVTRRLRGTERTSNDEAASTSPAGMSSAATSVGCASAFAASTAAWADSAAQVP